MGRFLSGAALGPATSNIIIPLLLFLILVVVIVAIAVVSVVVVAIAAGRRLPGALLLAARGTRLLGATKKTTTVGVERSSCAQR